MIGERFLDLARKMLVMHRTDPAGLRSVVSRAYYGAFHSARTFLEDMGCRVARTENAHQFVQIRLLNSGEERATKLGTLLTHLHERRKDADYEIDSPQYETEDFAVEAITRADRAMALLADCREELVRSKIKAGIASYERKINPGA
ncbi:MAG TPA: HEPN domain-containing protein [Pirellulales bacterium]|nr:HEPN domain-containing protein [Pirellulales bacterium]